ncbi:hypothetical protein [Streptosporangium sandarakinum]|uniref:hypothetical protein n=1 Tax=Streptosporangium sandarakinum TaxID=1260955 RepID=UPI00378B702C
MTDAEKMRALLDDYESQRKREDQAFADGFRIGWDDGYSTGYGRALVEMEEAWHALAEKVRALGKGRQ